MSQIKQSTKATLIAHYLGQGKPIQEAITLANKDIQKGEGVK